MKQFICVLLFILFNVSCSSDKSTQPADQPQTSQNIPAPTPAPQALESLPIIPGRPIEAATGDWDSFGAPPVLPKTDRDYRFKCTGFLQDQLVRKGLFCAHCNPIKYWIYRLYSFEISKEQNIVNLHDLSYQKIAYLLSGDHSFSTQTLEVDMDVDLKSPKATVSLHYNLDYRFEPPSPALKMQLYIGQLLGNYSVFQTREVTADFESLFFTNKLSIDARDSHFRFDDEIPRMSLEVRCERAHY